MQHLLIYSITTLSIVPAASCISAATTTNCFPAFSSFCVVNVIRKWYGVTSSQPSLRFKEGLFADLYRFADPDFFKEHEQIYLYLDGNVLTYEVFAAYERENTSLIRTYDFTYLSGCEQFLKDLYATRDMSMNGIVYFCTRYIYPCKNIRIFFL